MLSIEIISQTYSTFSFNVLEAVDFDEMVLYISEKDSPTTVLVDRLTPDGNDSYNPVIRQDSNGTFHVDINRIDYTTVFYKDFHFSIYKGSVLVDQTGPLSIAPEIKSHFSGIVQKLNYDFDIEVNFSGGAGRIFKSDVTGERCTCWDNILMQTSNSACSQCNGTGMVVKELIPIDFKMKKIKSQRNEFVADKGKEIISQSIFLTYSRLDFSIGQIFLDLKTYTFYEVKSANIAHIGEIRTSTRIIAVRVPSNDSRVSRLPSS